jgi:hypothetical protein
MARRLVRRVEAVFVVEGRRVEEGRIDEILYMPRDVVYNSLQQVRQQGLLGRNMVTAPPSRQFTLLKT